MARNSRIRAPAAPKAVAVPAAQSLRKAEAHHAAGRLAEAESAYQAILKADPTHAEAKYKIGLISTQAGHGDRAVPYLVAALKQNPDEPRYWLSLATTLLGVGRVPDARSILERFAERAFEDRATLTARSAIIEEIFHEAQRLYQTRAFAQAEALLDIIVMLDANHVEAIHLAGLIAAVTDRPELAYDLMSISIHKGEGIGRFFVNLANLFSNKKKFGEAIQCLRKALETEPDDALTHNNLGTALHRAGLLQEAVHHLDRAIALNGGTAMAYNNLGVVYSEFGDVERAIAAYDRALSIDPDYHIAHANRVYARLYAIGSDPERQLADARAFGHRFADPLLRKRPFGNDRDPERRLRVGFVSSDFCEHAVNYFFEPALRRFDPDNLELFAYSNTHAEDHATARLKTHVHHWRVIRCLDDDEAADMIEADGIDILVDLNGHTAGNRLFLFARKPAPIQVTWIGYPGTTGLSAIDYRLTDMHSDPEGLTERYSVERLWRLPRVGACYQANPICPAPVAQAPFEENGHITFGCFNRITKISDEALATWARILQRLPDARILFEVANIDNPETRAAVEERLERLGFPLERVQFELRASYNRYVLYNRVDIALDPYPYNGGTTSLDTLYMGVPFIALEGGHYVARMGHSILSNVGLPELSTRTPEDYVTLACALATDRDQLRALRHDLRGRMMRSPHMDSRQLAADVGDAFRAMWRRWIEADRVGEAS